MRSVVFGAALLGGVTMSNESDAPLNGCVCRDINWDGDVDTSPTPGEIFCMDGKNYDCYKREDNICFGEPGQCIWGDGVYHPDMEVCACTEANDDGFIVDLVKGASYCANGNTCYKHYGPCNGVGTMCIHDVIVTGVISITPSPVFGIDACDKMNTAALEDGTEILKTHPWKPDGLELCEHGVGFCKGRINIQYASQFADGNAEDFHTCDGFCGHLDLECYDAYTEDDNKRCAKKSADQLESDETNSCSGPPSDDYVCGCKESGVTDMSLVSMYDNDVCEMMDTSALEDKDILKARMVQCDSGEDSCKGYIRIDYGAEFADGNVEDFYTCDGFCGHLGLECYEAYAEGDNDCAREPADQMDSEDTNSCSGPPDSEYVCGCRKPLQDCVGEYGPCDGACQKTFAVTTPASSSGAACAAADGEVSTDCASAEDACPDAIRSQSQTGNNDDSSGSRVGVLAGTVVGVVALILG